AMVASFAATKVFLGDALFLALLASFVCCLASRAKERRDTPPPGFVLVGLAFVSVGVGGVLSIVQHYRDVDVFWITLQRLLSYQGFVLLPILGIGPFLLPRFFGMQSDHDFPEALIPPASWLKKAIIALIAGGLIISSFVMEAMGWSQSAHAIRFGTTL